MGRKRVGNKVSGNSSQSDLSDISLLVIGKESDAAEFLFQAGELFVERLYLSRLSHKALNETFTCLNGKWVFLLYASEQFNLQSFREWLQQESGSAAWGYAIAVDYTKNISVYPTRQWEVRLIRKDSGAVLTGFGLSMGCPGEPGTEYLQDVHLENLNPSGQELAPALVTTTPLKKYLKLTKQAQQENISDSFVNSCLEITSLLKDLGYFSAGCYLMAAQVLKSQADLAQAEAVAREGLTLFPNYADLHCFLGNLALDQGNIQEAISYFQQSANIRISPYPGQFGANSFLPRFGLGLAYEKRLEISRAVESFREAYSPVFREPLYNLGRILIPSIGIASARQTLEGLVNSHRDFDAEVMADVFYANGSYEAALEYLEGVEPNSSIYYFKGTLLAKLKRWPEAVVLFQQMEVTHELYWRGQLQICFCLWAENKLAQAERILEQFPEKINLEYRQYMLISNLFRKKTRKDNIPNCDWQVTLGLLNRFLEIQNISKAQKVSALLEKIPVQTVQLTLAKIYNFHRNYAKVVQCLKRAEDLGETNSEFFLSLAQALMNLGQLAKAFEILNRQVLEQKACIETYLLAARTLAIQSIELLQAESVRLKSDKLAQKAQALSTLISYEGGSEFA